MGYMVDEALRLSRRSSKPRFPNQPARRTLLPRPHRGEGREWQPSTIESASAISSIGRPKAASSTGRGPCLISAIHALKAIDIACGSVRSRWACSQTGLDSRKLDPDNARWRAIQLAAIADAGNHPRRRRARVHRQPARLHSQALPHRELPLRRGHPAHRRPDRQAPFLHLPGRGPEGGRRPAQSRRAAPAES